MLQENEDNIPEVRNKSKRGQYTGIIKKAARATSSARGNYSSGERWYDPCKSGGGM
jgi:hypothetical protein